MRFIGIDPDCDTVAVAEIRCESLSLRCSRCQIIRIRPFPEGAKDLVDLLDPESHEQSPCWVVIEGQTIHRKNSKADPDDILRLAQITGAAAAIVSAFTSVEKVLIPKPAEWKGQVPKDVDQGRTYVRFGWSSEKRGGKSPYRVPQVSTVSGVPEIHASAWKHLGDALGLAVWGYDQHRRMATTRIGREPGGPPSGLRPLLRRTGSVLRNRPG